MALSICLVCEGALACRSQGSRSERKPFDDEPADTFIHKGTNGRWQRVLDEEDMALYEAAMRKLPADYAQWLENGGPIRMQG